MKILILGANGNLGPALAEAYEGHDVIKYGRDDLDITIPEQVEQTLRQIRPELVFNCASYNAVDKAEEEESLAQEINGQAPGYLAQACKDTNAIFVHYSTDYVFDGTKPDGFNENDSPHPINAYGRSKLQGEQEVQKVGGKYYIVRTSWLYALPGTTGKKSFNEIMLEQATKDKVRAVDDEFGRPTYVKDLAEASRQLIAEQAAYGVYHLVNEGQASRYDWTKEIYRIKNISTPVEPVPAASFPSRPAQRPKYSLLNNTQRPPLRPWQEALRDYIQNNS
jgi:dTDP-4-dehydrorhamnose reductase